MSKNITTPVTLRDRLKFILRSKAVTTKILDKLVSLVDSEVTASQARAREEKKCNGWSNYETWVVKLWIDNEQSSQDYWREIAQEVYESATPNPLLPNQTVEEAFVYDLSQRLKSEFEENNPVTDASVYSDLMNAALSEVNWYEIAEHYVEDVDKGELDESEGAE